MASTTNIAWARSTFNPWIGCTKVGPGCDHCYAEAQDSRKRWGGAAHWGAGVPRYRTSPSNWAKPLQWNKAAPESEFAGRKGFWPVFCASLGDVFDNEVPDEWRKDLFDLIGKTPHLSWLLVTKRISNVARMVPSLEWLRFHDNVRILITVVNQEEADRDIPKLLALPCKNGISYEPALERVDFEKYFEQYPDRNGVRIVQNHEGINWLICGGESSQPGHPARPFNIQWARSTIAQCKAAGVPVFMKQCGSTPYEETRSEITDSVGGSWEGIRTWSYKDRAGADPAEWPEDLRVQEHP